MAGFLLSGDPTGFSPFVDIQRYLGGIFSSDVGCAPIMAISDTAARNAKPTEKTYRISDSGGLYLEICERGLVAADQVACGRP